jgi:hypothetical protein
VAAPSEAFAWKLFTNPSKKCWQCGREGLRVQDVGEHRRKYPGKVDQFLCKDCQASNVARAVREERERLGLQERKADQGP